MPPTKTSVVASALPLRIAFTTSCSVTGPTCWPPMAMYHWGVEDMRFPPSSSVRGRGVDAGGGLGLQPRDGGRVEAQAVGELGEVDALPAGHRLVGADDREGEGVELLLELGVGHAGHDLAEGLRRVEL